MVLIIQRRLQRISMNSQTNVRWENWCCFWGLDRRELNRLHHTIFHNLQSKETVWDRCCSSVGGLKEKLFPLLVLQISRCTSWSQTGILCRVIMVLAKLPKPQWVTANWLGKKKEEVMLPMSKCRWIWDSQGRLSKHLNRSVYQHSLVSQAMADVVKLLQESDERSVWL